ncbi:MAG: pyridoxamine 5'-phosphate oxidase family protein [Desulforhopalus sp.]
MNINEYFKEHKGTGVLATADENGKVNTAIYARPHVFDDSTVGFVMRDRLTRQNLLKNGNANYMFIESGPAYKGMRLGLKFLGESTDSELIASLAKRKSAERQCNTEEARFLVSFSVEKGLALVGGDEITLE